MNEIKKIGEEFNSKYPPKLERKGAEAVAGYVVQFLKDLQVFFLHIQTCLMFN
jgi:hypothetical protein